MMNQLDSPFNPSVDAGLDSMRIPPMARRAFRIVLAAQREKQSAIIETMRRALDISAARITYPQVDAIRSVMQTTGASQKAAVLALLITDGDVAAAARYAVSAMAD
jgi:NACalpha-BTF3-like transcription factor